MECRPGPRAPPSQAGPRRPPAAPPIPRSILNGKAREPMPVYTKRLQCVECGRVSEENERGWAARLTVDDEVAVFCPECDDREFRRRGIDAIG